MAYNNVHEFIQEPTRCHIGAQRRESQSPERNGYAVKAGAYPKGKRSSRGEVEAMNPGYIAGEIEIAATLGKPIEYMEPPDSL